MQEYKGKGRVNVVIPGPNEGSLASNPLLVFTRQHVDEVGRCGLTRTEYRHSGWWTDGVVGWGCIQVRTFHLHSTPP